MQEITKDIQYSRSQCQDTCTKVRVLYYLLVSAYINNSDFSASNKFYITKFNLASSSYIYSLDLIHKTIISNNINNLLAFRTFSQASVR